jgi:carbonic anhydrase/acetyltransferase-like protein (isoleucine patch superfamily)
VSGVILPYKGWRPKIGNGVFIAPTAAVIGNVEIDDEANIWFGCTLRAEDQPIRIGARTNVQDGTIFHIEGHDRGTYVGADVTIGHAALIHACTLEDGCFVGMSATVLNDAVIESGAMVAAGALVAPGKRVRAGELWAGVPAKPLRKLSDDDLATFTHTVEAYCRLARNYLAMATANE